MIYNKLTLNDFINAFKQGNRDYYTYEGYIALYEYLDELSEDCGTDIEFDMIALCCEFTQYESLEELADSYNMSFTEEQLKDVEGNKDEILDYFYNNTPVITCDDGSYITAEF